MRRSVSYVRRIVFARKWLFYTVSNFYRYTVAKPAQRILQSGKTLTIAALESSEPSILYRKKCLCTDYRVQAKSEVALHSLVPRWQYWMLVMLSITAAGGSKGRGCFNE